MDCIRNCCRKNCDKRTLSKTALWRVIASGTTFLAALTFSGEVKTAGTIMLLDASAKTLIYYLHEIAWKNCWPEQNNVSPTEAETEDTTQELEMTDLPFTENSSPSTQTTVASASTLETNDSVENAETLATIV